MFDNTLHSPHNSANIRQTLDRRTRTRVLQFIRNGESDRAIGITISAIFPRLRIEISDDNIVRVLDHVTCRRLDMAVNAGAHKTAADHLMHSILAKAKAICNEDASLAI